MFFHYSFFLNFLLFKEAVVLIFRDSEKKNVYTKWPSMGSYVCMSTLYYQKLHQVMHRTKYRVCIFSYGTQVLLEFRNIAPKEKGAIVICAIFINVPSKRVWNYGQNWTKFQIWFCLLQSNPPWIWKYSAITKRSNSDFCVFFSIFRSSVYIDAHAATIISHFAKPAICKQQNYSREEKSIDLIKFD